MIVADILNPKLALSKVVDLRKGGGKVDSIQVLVLAAGNSTRFEHPITKMLYKMDGMEMLRRVLQNLHQAGLTNVHLVIGHQAEIVRKKFPYYPVIVQKERLGTGHAVQMAKGLSHAENTMVIFGDKPLFSPETLRQFIQTHLLDDRVMTVATVIHPKVEHYSEGWGTVVRENGRLVALRKIEETNECDAALYLFKTDWLWRHIHLLRPHDNHGRGKVEYYLPDLVEIATRQGDYVGEYRVKDYREAIGINTPDQLAEAMQYLHDLEAS